MGTRILLVVSFGEVVCVTLLLIMILREITRLIALLTQRLCVEIIFDHRRLMSCILLLSIVFTLPLVFDGHDIEM